MKIQMVLSFLLPMIAVLLVTPLVIKLAHKIGATDKPNYRKVHAKIMPRLGGLAIFIGVAVGYFVAGIYKEQVTGITVGAILIILLGILDDMYELSAKVKLFGQILAASLVVWTGLTIDFITIPFIGRFELDFWAYPLSIFWIVAITNAINLIDGLDGLSAGISAISIGTVAIMAGIAGANLILTLSLIILGSIIGFLFYNFYPAKIFMGDTGALFLGYCISILSLLGLYKSVTLFSFIVPIIILGVPIFDTSFAIIRRLVNKRPISSPDKSHLHHRLLAMGLSHRNTVLFIYGIGIIFSISAVLFSSATLWGSILILFMLFIGGLLLAEVIGLVHEKKSEQVMKVYRKVSGRQ